MIFVPFTHMKQVAPIAVYTSGKGSSAAGLTASVQRDAISVGLVNNGPVCPKLTHFIA